ncbi:MAG: FprA family A-type flavoprotein [Bacteroidales bacterium]
MIQELAAGIFYTGVNERKSKLFESLWPLPYGVSYNSYLIVDEKVVLVDMAEESMSDLHFLKLKAILGDRPIDYVVINHMEPDHTGSLRALYSAYPEITVIGNNKTLAMVEGFYDIHPKTLKVIDGDEINIGTHTLRFHLTPMLHWPETMMTYEVTTQTLFSGDAFGCFGALNGAIMDYEIDLSLYWDEMRRYYATIVGKYGSPVQMALKKLQHVPISMICSTHGPVWKENVAKVIGLYDRYSRYEAEQGVVVAYGSMYGHTAIMAEQVAESIAAGGIRNIQVFDVSSTDSSFILSAIFAWKGLVLAGPVYNSALFPPLQYLMDEIKARDIKDRIFGSLGTYAWGAQPLRLFEEFGNQMKWQSVHPTIEQKYAMHAYRDTPCDALGKAMAEALLKR